MPKVIVTCYNDEVCMTGSLPISTHLVHSPGVLVFGGATGLHTVLSNKAWSSLKTRKSYVLQPICGWFPCKITAYDGLNEGTRNSRFNPEAVGVDEACQVLPPVLHWYPKRWEISVRAHEARSLSSCRTQTILYSISHPRLLVLDMDLDKVYLQRQIPRL